MIAPLTPDLCIIGAGSAGLTAAAVAAGFGVPVVLVERDRMGGDCLNVGCVPSKALLAAARQAASASKPGRFGVATGPVHVDYAAVQAHIRDTIAAIAPNDSVERFTGLGVTVLKGEGRFIAPDCLAVGETRIKARRFVIATGSRPFIPPIPGLDTVPFLTNESIFTLEALPARLIVIGGGPIGLELGQAYRRLGSEVTIIEAGRLLGRVDREAAAIIADHLRAEGVRLIEGARVDRVETMPGEGVRVLLTGAVGEESIDGSHLLIAAGRSPNIEGLGLDAAGVGHTVRGIDVDRGLRTANRRIYAIGDVTGGLQFTHAAGAEGALVIRNVLFRLPIRKPAAAIPRTLYTDPEIASVGQTEEEARAAHPSGKILRWSFHDNDRARAEDDTTGFVKIFTTRRGRILGGVIVGAQAGDLLAPLGLAVARGLSVSDLAAWIPAYPTRVESIRRAAVEFYRPGLTNPWLRRIIGLLRKLG